jgi:hypothetical protein
MDSVKQYQRQKNHGYFQAVSLSEKQWNLLSSFIVRKTMDTVKQYHCKKNKGIC